MIDRPEAEVGDPPPRSLGRKILFLPLPWLFLALLGSIAWHFVLPAMQQGAIHGYLLAPVFLLVGSSFGAAAVTISRDVMTGRYH